ncbi:MAG: carbohydrate kinase [Verrucomicrobia bacterium]|nr:carbohydrate kinase [Verrucomicrobiota bacterium]
MPTQQSSNAAWLGLDLGTQSARAMIVSGNGETLAIGSHKLTSRRDGPRHEQDPEEWWRAISTASRAALRELPPGFNLHGVAVDGTSGTILLVDGDSRPLTPGLMYDDTRAVEETKRANEAGAAVWARLGYNRMQVPWGLPKLLWLLSQQHGWALGTRLAHQTDFINRRLVGGEVATDTSNALKTGVDLVNERWPHEVFAALAVPDEILPEVVRAGTALGVVSAEAAGQTGIPRGTPVIAGMTDGCAAQMGAGALNVGSWNSVLGTTLVLKGVTPDLIKDPAGVVYSHRSPDGNWLPGGASSVGAGAIAKHFPERDLEALGVEAAEREPAGIVTYPLHGRGERFPFIAPEAEGFTLGQPTDKIDQFAALLQGVAFIERLCFDYLDLLGAPVDGPFVLTGGGAKSPYWCQLRADVLGSPIALPENAEAALGMAVLAAAVGRKVADVAREMVRVREVIDPRSDRIARFREPYLRLVDELARRGWLAPAVAQHAHRRAAP